MSPIRPDRIKQSGAVTESGPEGGGSRRGGGGGGGERGGRGGTRTKELLVSLFVNNNLLIDIQWQNHRMKIVDSRSRGVGPRRHEPISGFASCLTFS